MLLFCHVISQDQEIKISRDFIGKSTIRYLIILPSLVAIGGLVGEIWFLFARDLARPNDQSTKCFIVRSFLRYVTILPSLVAMDSIIGFSLLRNLARLRNQRAMWFFVWVSFMVSHFFSKEMRQMARF